LSCLAELPTLSLAIDGKWIVLNGADLLLDVSAQQDKSLCMFSFVPNSEQFWYLGQSVYKDYYIVHDPDNLSMHFAPTESHLKTPLEKV
jgi:hypothetical protein